MAKVKIDVRGVDSSQRKQPKPGVYKCKILSADVKEPEGKEKRIEVVYEITQKKGGFQGSKLYDYCNLVAESQKFKTRQLLEAVFGKLSKKQEFGTFDTDKLVGENVLVKVIEDTYLGEYKAKVALPFNVDADKDIDDDEPEDEPEDDESDEADDDADDDDEAEEEDDEVEEEEDEVDLDSMSRTELKAFIKENDLDITVKKSMKDKAIREAIAEALDEDDEPDYDEWSVDELKDECDARGVGKGGKKAVLIKRLREDDENDEDPFEDED